MEVIFNRKDYRTYKDFYKDIYEKMDGKRFGDLDHFSVPLGYSADHLNEFLWYCDIDDKGNKYIFKNFDLEKIKNYKNFDNYKYNLIFKVFERFVKEYPNNSIEFINDEEK